MLKMQYLRDLRAQDNLFRRATSQTKKILLLRLVFKSDVSLKQFLDYARGRNSTEFEAQRLETRETE